MCQINLCFVVSKGVGYRFENEQIEILHVFLKKETAGTYLSEVKAKNAPQDNISKYPVSYYIEEVLLG